MKHNRPTNADLMLLMAFAIAVLCMALAGCGTTSATVATKQVQLILWMNAAAVKPYNEAIFYSGNLNDTNLTTIGTVATTNGIALVTNQTILQNVGTTKIYAAGITNTTLNYRTFTDVLLRATNAL